MGSDRARITFDATRDYRSVVAQQGRVTLEADVNEQSTIEGEALRIETIDVVGPAGTPDNGYEVTTDGNDNLTVGAGVMYTGGWRLELDQAVPLNNQPDWIDQPPPDAAAKGSSLVALLAIEQSISATEDQALLEPALGGPDTSARNRLMQHFVQIPSPATQCGDAEKRIAALLRNLGLHWDLKTTALDFTATLQVNPFQPPSTADPCCPPAQGGYLGSDNQLVQVTVADLNAGAGHLLWGWNNASFLYRATWVNATTVALDQAPIDAAHTPQPGQVVEILQTTAVLGNPNDDNYVAALQGQIFTLGSGSVYTPSSQQITLPGNVTQPPAGTTLFVRLWQGLVPFNSGASATLDAATGIAVTVTINALPTGPLTSRPYWSFAVRPNLPQQVLPVRYMQMPQPPDGPRMWLCALAVFTPGTVKGPVTPDCRKFFQPLIDLGPCDCCAVSLNPSEDWLGKLNTANNGNATVLSICFQPGTFAVSSKITFSNKSVKMTGAGRGTQITGGGLEVVFEFDNCPDVTLTDLSVTAGSAGYSPADGTRDLQGAVTIRDCAQVDIERLWLACADADLRSASCLAVYNTAPVGNAAQLPSNVRVLNSQFQVGASQVGVLLVNTDRAQVEGNLITTPMKSSFKNLNDIVAHPLVALRVAKQLVHEMTIVNTAAKTSKRALKKARKNQAPAEKTEASHAGSAGATAPATNTEGPAAPPSSLVATPAPPHVNLGALGLSHINTTFGSIKLQFISSNKLTNAWTDALTKAGLNNATMGAVHLAVKNIARNAVLKPEAAAPAFRNYVQAILPQLYSTASQGIVVGGTVGSDIRILNNTIAGTAQGIHVGLSNMKISATHLQVEQLKICGNSIAVRMTPASFGGRHGIYVAGVTSALIDNNDLTLTRTADASQEINGIMVRGALGSRVLVERNYMRGFTVGIFAQPFSHPDNVLWKAADNWSNAHNFIPGWIFENNVLP